MSVVLSVLFQLQVINYKCILEKKNISYKQIDLTVKAYFSFFCGCHK